MMQPEKLKQIGLRLATYVLIGLVTTGGMWITWNLLYVIVRKMGFDQTIGFSVSQYFASGIWILPSFYLNRIFTFKDKKLINAKTIMLGKVILIYSLAPLIASGLTYGIQVILRLDIETIRFDLNFGGRLYAIPYLYLLLQVVGIGMGLLINFFGQYFLIYSTNPAVLKSSGEQE